MINGFVLMAWGIAVASIYIIVYYLLLLIEMEGEPRRRYRRQPDVTIAIPAYNEGKHVRKSLDSLLVSNYPLEKIHAVVVDDGSKDHTRKEVRKFIREHPDFDVKLLVNSKNRGKAYSLNRVLKTTTTDFMITMDADSEAHPHALSELIKYSKDVSIVTPCVLPRNRKGRIEKVQEIEYIYSNYLASLLSGFDAQTVAPGPFSLFRVVDLKNVGGFDEDSVAEDLEVVFRMRKGGHSMRLAPHAKVYTEIPIKLGGLVKQRKRWKQGFLYAVNKHPKGIAPHTEFGRQNLMNFLYIFVTLSVLFLFARGIFVVAEPALNVIRYVGFDIWPYLQSMHFSIDFLSLDIQMTLYISVVAFITSIFLYVATQFHDRRINPFDAFLFMFVYGLAISTATLLATYSWVKGDRKW
ncbi:MAG: glycosyltransferase family 2 protein [Candidatus Altiarchaeota archaeon]|nr:glycosyltransferase family 2 protein [Candidatus Altiarchaeota archaeon]